MDEGILVQPGRGTGGLGRAGEHSACRGLPCEIITKEKLNSVPAGVRRFSASKSIRLFAPKQGADKQHDWYVCRIPIDILRGLATAIEDERQVEVEAGVSLLISFISEVIVVAFHFTRMGGRRA